MPKSLLVADDSLTIRKVIGMVFSTEDVQITAVDNGLDAIAKARELRPDLVLADVAMPGKSGYEVCEALKSDPATQAIPVLLLSGSFAPFDEGRAQAAGANGRVTKPFESQQLVDQVRALVGGWGVATQAPAAAAGGPVRPSAPLANGVRPQGQPGAPPAPSPFSTPQGGFAPRPGQPMPMPGQAARAPGGPIPTGTVPGYPRPPMAAPSGFAGGGPGPRPAPPGMARPGFPPTGAPLPPGQRIPPGTVSGYPRPPGVGGPQPVPPPAGMYPPGAPRPPMAGMSPGAPFQRPGMPVGPPQGMAPGFPRPPGGGLAGVPGGLPRAPGGLPPLGPGAGSAPPAARARDPFGLNQPAPAAPPLTEDLSLSLDDAMPSPAGVEEISLDLDSPAPAPPAVTPPPARAPSDGGEAVLRDALSKASREVVEKIAWEVVPQLAETIIREHLDRLIKERELQNPN